MAGMCACGTFFTQNRCLSNPRYQFHAYHQVVQSAFEKLLREMPDVVIDFSSAIPVFLLMEFAL